MHKPIRQYEQHEHFQSFLEFWPYYVREHGRPGTRRLHFTGTLLALLCLILAIALRQPWWLLAAPVLGYGSAWIGHLFVERNRPATFRYPWWSLRGDLRMFWLTLTRRMGRELRAVGPSHKPDQGSLTERSNAASNHGSGFPSKNRKT